MVSSQFFRPFDVVEGDRGLGLVLIADHAGRALPQEYGDLGLPAGEFDRHIAYDIGVEPLTRRLAELTGAPAVLANFSRLLIDANRGEDDPTLIRQLYDGTIVPANYPMSDAERDRRLDGFYRPYHAAVGSMIASVVDATGAAPFVFSLHSFTPALRGRARTWHAGVLWDMDDRAPLALIGMLARDAALVVGDNEPYDGALRGDTLYRHAIVSGYAHALLEVRQDLIADAAGVEAWAQRLAPIVEEVNRKPDMHVVRHYGSRTGPLLRHNGAQR